MRKLGLTRWTFKLRLCVIAPQRIKGQQRRVLSPLGWSCQSVSLSEDDTGSTCSTSGSGPTTQQIVSIQCNVKSELQT